MNPRIRLRLATFAAVVLASCTSPLAPADIAGDYELVSVNGVLLSEGPGAVAGVVRLRAPALAERSITYAAPDGSRTDQVLMGGFTVEGGDIRLALQDGSYIWRPPVALLGRVLTITYPSPADGPATIERYERR